MPITYGSCQWLTDTARFSSFFLAEQQKRTETSVLKVIASRLCWTILNEMNQCLGVPHLCTNNTNNLFMFAALLDVLVWFCVCVFFCNSWTAAAHGAHDTCEAHWNVNIIYCSEQTPFVANMWMNFKSNVNFIYISIWPFTDPFNKSSLYIKSIHSHISDCMLIEANEMQWNINHWR